MNALPVAVFLPVCSGCSGAFTFNGQDSVFQDDLDILAGDYPFSLPETRAIGMFLMSHPNVAAYQSYHNAGGIV